MKKNSQFTLRLPLKLLLSLLLLLPLFLNAQWNYSGLLQPVAMNRTSDFSTISLPFRIAELDVGFTKGNFDFKTNSALEYRWSGEDTQFDIREAYMIWYPSWGEVKVGKQIHAWGAVDGNNPTDNLNPYDYYFMFLPGTDRKIGTLSGSLKYYWNDWKMEAVIIPEHKSNRLPFGEKDFPIAMNDPGDLVKDAKDGGEYGLYLQTVVGNSDIGFSYFSGRDRGFTLNGYNWNLLGPGPEVLLPSPSLSYRKTEMYGIDFVSFIGEFTCRTEIGYFNTKNDYESDLVMLENASYLQYAAQLEYLTPYDITIIGQVIGSEVLNIKGSTLVFSPIGIPETSPMEKDDFQPGMGTPFAMFTDLGIFLSTSANFWDSTLEIRLNTFLDLKDSQSLLGGGFTYSPIDNWKIDCSISQFMGEEGTQFKAIEDFSHLSFGIKYNF